MSYNIKTESTTCYKCGKFIRWGSNNEGDERFWGVYDKMLDHQKNDKQCRREEKLKEILGDDEVKPKERLNLTFLDEK